MTAGFKITYTTLGANLEEFHRAFDEAAIEVQRGLGKAHPLEIGAESRTGAGLFEDRSPCDTRLLVGRFPKGTREDFRAAFTAAKAAYPAWSRTPWGERVARVRAAAETIADRRFRLAALLVLEAGKSRTEAMGEVEESADLLRYYARQVEENGGYDRPMGRLAENEETRSVGRPYGPFAVIAPFNFPAALPAGMAAGALLAGNTVVFKPSGDGPAIGGELWKALVDGGIPRGVVNFVTGSGGVFGEEVLSNPDVAGIVFTGSKEVGMGLWKGFGREFPKPCIVEMGGKNAAIVTAKADLEKASEGVMRAAFGYGGQKCSACSRVYVHRDVEKAFLDRLLEKTRAIKIGHPIRREVFLGPLINEEARRRYEETVRWAAADGEILHGGRLLGGGEYAHGFYVEPTVVTGLPKRHRLFREERFVPVLPVTTVDSLEEAVALANDSEYGLTAGIFSEDPAEVEFFFENVEAGVTYANRRSGATTGAWPGVNPFCGWKGSGNTGRGACGPYYVQQFLREQSRTWMR
ncbi:MAG TPA: aldehyde dehydrogenase family protein [Planctomycetota bacterium]|nr:aldehyde dehydrogenase family protein [Planctomycetota bacterium]